ncbi:uncharacterized protein [Fopius arisanus]|uniref:XseA_0 protein n=1 Tax=Fopius arisanus TaxID=64838 RepID=A0A0C9S0R8_9HYME|nr:PREDICTED: uncharacterized protein LOC105269571 [Fopius arisanus]
MSEFLDSSDSQEEENGSNVTIQESTEIGELKLHDFARVICKEIIDQAIREGYWKFMEETSYSYVVHCSYLAWAELFEKIQSSDSFRSEEQLSLEPEKCDRCICGNKSPNKENRRN